jgi:hypothetical protein
VAAFTCGGRRQATPEARWNFDSEIPANIRIMYYIVDDNKSRKRPRPYGYEGAGPDLVTDIGPFWYVEELLHNSSVPAWQKFVQEGRADSEAIKQMIAECPKLPLPTDYTQRVADQLSRAVPPIYIAQD